VKPERSPTKAVLYTRVSTGKQAESGLGLEAQLAKCRAHAEAHGYTVVGEFRDEAISGKDTIEARPELQKALQHAARNEDVVFVSYSLSRLSRRQSLTWRLLDDRGDYRLQFESVTEPFTTSTPMGRAMLGMVAIWAQLEADMCSERTSAALEARRARGYKLGPRFLAQEQPEVVKMIQELYQAGGWTHASLAAHLNERGVRTKRGKRWHATQVRRTLMQEVAPYVLGDWKP
jgi:site-specific DNA recombinase